MDGSATKSAGLPQRVRLASSEPDEAREFLGRLYGAHLKVAGAGDPMRISFDRVEGGGITLNTARCPAVLDFHLEGDDQVLLTTVMSGRVTFVRGRAEARYGPGDIYIGNQPRADWHCRLRSPNLDVVGLPAALLHDVADTGSGGRWQPRSWEPLPGYAEQWLAAVRYVRELFDQPYAAGEPLVVGAAVRMLAATALTAFPGDVSREPSIEDRHDAHRETLRRAIAFIESNPHVDLGVADIARAANVTARALGLTFRRHLGVTPMAYLWRVRLDKAREDLSRATAGDDRTISLIANRWGFADPARFAMRYRRAYGETPGQTLRR
ncbi:AraC family transcriptional regulator [Micromonospora sp. RP3T]|uniref:AraC family transcriptional regulator n=1 Tax=Micromonospora sp. RP3T TaxID=2135446 RepID=UPI000D1535AF|nr:AraC family transcriptional regulator [Micromonospora sp. RP3T]PTA46462.1 AraC family transcriptional regulator [Micromonospora sp. RP3T]